MKSPVTLESLLTRVKKEVANKEKLSAVKKEEARLERLRRQPPQGIFEREDLWLPVALHREYEVQHCDSCKQELTVFSCERVELRHKIDRSARRWLRERGEGMQDLPMFTTVVQRVVPECFCCYTLGRFSTSLWKGKHQDENHKASANSSNPPQGRAAPQEGQRSSERASVPDIIPKEPRLHA